MWAFASDPDICRSCIDLSLAVYTSPSDAVGDVRRQSIPVGEMVCAQEYSKFNVLAFQQLGCQPCCSFIGPLDPDSTPSTPTTPSPSSSSSVPPGSSFWNDTGSSSPPPEAFHKSQWVAATPKNNPSVLLVAFKGTSDAIDFLLDMSLVDIRTDRGNRIHCGVYCGVQDELPVIQQVAAWWISSMGGSPSRVVLTGHSLGGAYATAAAVEWRGEVPPEAITFGAPLVLSRVSPAVVRPPRLTHFVMNFDIVPRLMAIRRSTLIALMDEVPRVLGGALMRQLAAAAMKFTGFGADRFADSIDPLRSLYRAVGTFVFVQSLEGVWDEGLTTARRTSFCVFHSYGTEANTRAYEHLQYFPADDTTPIALSVLDEKAVVIAKAFEDHSLLTDYIPAVAQLVACPLRWTRALLFRGLPPAKIRRSLSCSLTAPPPMCAMPPRAVGYPWCVVNRCGVPLKMQRVGGVHPLPSEGAVVLQDGKAGESISILGACSVVLPGRSGKGVGHLAIEHSGLGGYIMWEVIMLKGAERDLRCIYPKAADTRLLSLHKLCYFLSCTADDAWTVTDIFGVCRDEDKGKADNPTCRACYVKFGVWKSKHSCSRCGLYFCKSCIASAVLPSLGNSPVPLCAKCKDITHNACSAVASARGAAVWFRKLFLLATMKVPPDTIPIISAFGVDGF